MTGGARRTALVMAGVAVVWLGASGAATRSMRTGPSGAAAGDAAGLLARVVHLSDSDVRIRTAGGATVAVDPMTGAAELQAREVRVADPELILVTHSHLDHYNIAVLRDYVSRNPKAVVAGPPDVARYAGASGVAVTEVAPGREYTFAGITFRTLPAYYADGADHPRENGWVGYLVRVDRATYYVTGDTQPLPEMAGLKPDVLFVPVFGCGSNVEQALEVVRVCSPKVVVPVHTGDHLDVIAAFLARLPRGVQCGHYEDATLVLGRGAPSSRLP